MTFWGRKQRELRDELESHIRMAAQDRIERGEDAVGARQHARRELGNETLIRETARDQWGLRWLETLLQDLRYAIHAAQITRLHAACCRDLALGIGSVTLIFSAVYGVILNTFPFRDAEQVTSFDIQDLSRPTNYRESLSMPEFLYLREHSQAFQDFSGESKRKFVQLLRSQATAGPPPDTRRCQARRHSGVCDGSEAVAR